MKPTFLILGSAKCATTSVCALMSQHPDVFISDPKEINYFSADWNFSRGSDWYENFFAPGKGCLALGEGSPRYTLRKVYPDAPARIAEALPDAKLIYMVRHPLRRIESAWIHMHHWNKPHEEQADSSFTRALRVNRSWLVDSANYLQELDAYRQWFDDDQILVQFFEDFKGDFRSVLANIFDFIGVAPDFELDASGQHQNRSVGRRVPRASLQTIRSLPGMGTARALLPQGLKKNVAERIFSRRINRRPQWTREAHSWVVEELEEDTQRFLERYGKPSDFWQLD